MLKHSKLFPKKGTEIEAQLNRNEVWGIYISNKKNKKESFETFCKDVFPYKF